MDFAPGQERRKVCWPEKPAPSYVPLVGSGKIAGEAVDPRGRHANRFHTTLWSARLLRLAEHMLDGATDTQEMRPPVEVDGKGARDVSF